MSLVSTWGIFPSQQDISIANFYIGTILLKLKDLFKRVHSSILSMILLIKVLLIKKKVYSLCEVYLKPNNFCKAVIFSHENIISIKVCPSGCLLKKKAINQSTN